MDKLMEEDQKLEAIREQVDAWFDEFSRSPAYDALTETQRAEGPAIAVFFADYASNYLGLEPHEWDPAGVRECCVDILPRKVTAQRAFFEAVAPVLTAFFNFLAERQYLPQGRQLAQTVARLDKEIVAASQDRRNWGFAKDFAMAAMEAGVDLRDEQAMDRFMAEYNMRLLAAMQPPQTVRLPVPAPALSLPAPATPVHRPGPKIGRNDPCPCGSGKKFKKCCGQ